MRRPLVLLAVFALAGCAGHHAGTAAADSTGAAQAAPRRARTDRWTVTADEIAEYGGNFNNVYDFLATRHNDWFQNSPGVATLRGYQIQVYVDGVRFGRDPTTLKQVPLRGVALARRLQPSEAEGKYGTDNNAGAIEVWTRLELVR